MANNQSCITSLLVYIFKIKDILILEYLRYREYNVRNKKGELADMGENIMDTLKVLANKRMEMSLLRVRERDLVYKKKLDQVMQLEKEYEMFALDKEGRKLIDKLLETIDEANIEQASIAYLAGLEDCILMLKSIGMLQI